MLANQGEATVARQQVPGLIPSLDLVLFPPTVQSMHMWLIGDIKWPFGVNVCVSE